MRLERNGKGLWIVLEGPGGVGKTTQAQMLSDFFNRNGWKVLRTKEPTNYTAFGRVMRTEDAAALSWQEKLAFFFADRVEHMANHVVPFLNEEGMVPRVVVQDRYWLTTAVYQKNPELVATMHSIMPSPDKIVLLEAEGNYLHRRLTDRQRDLHWDRASVKECCRRMEDYSHLIKHPAFRHNGMIVSAEGAPDSVQTDLTTSLHTTIQQHLEKFNVQ